MTRRFFAFLVIAFALLAALPASAQSDPLVIPTPFSGPRAEWSPDGSQIAIFQDANFATAFEEIPLPGATAVQLHDPVSGALLTTLHGARDFVGSLLFTPDGAQVVAVLANGDVLTWDTASGDLVSSARTPLLGARLPLFWHPQTGALVVASPNQSHTSYLAIDPATGALTLLTSNPPITTFGEWRVAQDERASRIFNDIVVVPAPHSEALAGLPLAGDEVWTVDVQGKVALLSLGTGESQVLREGDERPMFDVRSLFATEGGLVAYPVPADDTLFVFDLTTGEMQEIPIEHESATLSGDGQTVAQYSADATALLISGVSDAAARKLALPAGLAPVRPLLGLQFSPDDARLLAAGLQTSDEQGTILVFDL
jgi:WD40 repeat protein